MPMVMVETFDEFCARNGGAASAQRIGEVHLFPNGAGWKQGHTGAIPFEAPTDIASALQMRRTFHVAKVGIFKTAFEHLTRALTGAGESFRWDARDLGPDPGDGDDPIVGRQQLLHLKRKHAEHKATLAEIDAQIEELPETKAKRAHEAKLQAMDSAQKAKQHAYWNAIKDIELV